MYYMTCTHITKITNQRGFTLFSGLKSIVFKEYISEHMLSLKTCISEHLS